MMTGKNWKMILIVVEFEEVLIVDGMALKCDDYCLLFQVGGINTAISAIRAATVSDGLLQRAALCQIRRFTANCIAQIPM